MKSQLRAIIDDATAAEHKKERDAARWSDHNTGQGHRAKDAQSVELARSLQADGKTIREIAEALGKSRSTVGRWLS